MAAPARAMGASGSLGTSLVVIDVAIGDIRADGILGVLYRRVRTVEPKLQVHVLDDGAAEPPDNALPAGGRVDDPASTVQCLEPARIGVPTGPRYVDQPARLGGAEQGVLEGQLPGTRHAPTALHLV